MCNEYDNLICTSLSETMKSLPIVLRRALLSQSRVVRTLRMPVLPCLVLLLWCPLSRGQSCSTVKDSVNVEYQVHFMPTFLHMETCEFNPSTNLHNVGTQPNMLKTWHQYWDYQSNYPSQVVSNQRRKKFKPELERSLKCVLCLSPR